MSAPIDIMRFVEEDVGGPLIAMDDLYTRWSMKVVKEKHVIEVGGCDVVPMTSRLIWNGLIGPERLSSMPEGLQSRPR